LFFIQQTSPSESFLFTNKSFFSRFSLIFLTHVFSHNKKKRTSIASIFCVFFRVDYDGDLSLQYGSSRPTPQQEEENERFPIN
jgi:hypothetical protein